MNTIMIIIYPRNPGFYHVSTILLVDLFIFVINFGVLSGGIGDAGRCHAIVDTGTSLLGVPREADDFIISDLFTLW